MKEAHKYSAESFETQTLLLRKLPSVDSLMNQEPVKDLEQEYGRGLVLESVRNTLEEARTAVLNGSQIVPTDDQIVSQAHSWLERLVAPTLCPVINATGVIIHTNLGRAPLSVKSRIAIENIAGVYSNLEYDLDTGGRGSRAAHVESFLTRLTGAENALVVNNNAAAILLTLSALCREGEVIISRGQLIEIGGGFRIPDVMAQSGAKLVEVGTTNRTHLADYERSITPDTAAILVAHHSNFKVIGFTSEPTLSDLAALAKEMEIPLLYDQGSGAILDTQPFGLEETITVQQALEFGVHLVMFSGDKLLGGPQAGILVGQKSLVDKLRKHPLARALRADKMELMALSATLDSYLRDRALDEIPVWQMIARSLQEIETVALRWTRILRENDLKCDVIEGHSTVGGGSLPGTTLPTKLVALSGINPQKLADDLRRAEPPIVARISENQYLVDPRTVLPEQESPLLDNIINFAKMQP